MKKSILIALSIALVAGTMSSCSKSSKGKMEGDWTIDSYSGKTTTTSGGSSSTYTTTISGATITDTYTSGGVTTSQTGTVSEASWTIGKDGTWSKKTNVTYTTTIFGSTTTTNIVTTTSGNWDFLIGVGDDYKKKERVSFHTLNWAETVVETTGSSSTTDTDTQTFKDGENAMIYVITESKKKSLMMTAEAGGTSDSGTTTASTEEYTLSQP